MGMRFDSWAVAAALLLESSRGAMRKDELAHSVVLSDLTTLGLKGDTDYVKTLGQILDAKVVGEDAVFLKEKSKGDGLVYYGLYDPEKTRAYPEVKAVLDWRRTLQETQRAKEQAEEQAVQVRKRKEVQLQRQLVSLQKSLQNERQARSRLENKNRRLRQKLRQIVRLCAS